MHIFKAYCFDGKTEDLNLMRTSQAELLYFGSKLKAAILIYIFFAFSDLYHEIQQFREACGDAHMKTILAVGELGTFTNVYKASLVSMMAGKLLILGL